MVQIIQKALTFPSETRSLKEIREFVREGLSRARLDDRSRRLVILGIDEAVTNIIGHRADRPGEAEIEVGLDIDDVRVRVTIEDRGEDGELPPLPLADLERRLRAEPTRCVGIFLIRQVMDEVTYRYKKGFQNELILVKFTGPPKA